MSATLYVPSILIDDVFTALIAFLQPFVGNFNGTNITPNVPTPIVRGQQNQVNPPQPAFVKVTEILRKNLDTPTFENSTDPNVQQAAIGNSKQLDIQIDFYGSNSANWSAAVESVWRSPYAPEQFPAGIAPLYCSDAHQGPLITGEEQYENRWVITASLEYNPLVIVPQQSATQFKTNIFEDIP